MSGLPNAERSDLDGPELINSRPRIRAQERAEQSAVDCRSTLVLAEPTFGPGYVSWRGMALAGGKVVCDVTGSTRTVVLEEAISALDEAGVDTETGPDGLPSVFAHGDARARESRGSGIDDFLAAGYGYSRREGQSDTIIPVPAALIQEARDSSFHGDARSLLSRILAVTGVEDQVAA